VLALALAGALAAGCGDGHNFTASDFVDRMSRQGLAIRLGRELPSMSGAEHLYAVALPPLPGEPPPPPGSEAGPGASGSLYVYGDSGAAGDQLAACRRSGGLLCFQAQNIVVVLDQEGSPIEAGRLAEAIKRLPSASP
jgi:hypothetical protein